MESLISSKSFRAFLAVAIILPSLAFFASYSYFSSKRSSAPIDTNAATITEDNQALLNFSEGEIEIGDPENGWKSLPNGQLINKGNFVRTLTNSRALIQFKNGNYVSLDSNTMVELTDISKGNIELVQYSGQVFSIVAKSNNKHTVILDDIKFESQGTLFLTQYKNSFPSLDVISSQVAVNLSGILDDPIIEIGQSYTHDISKSVPERITSIPTSAIKNNQFLSWNKELLRDNDNIDSLGLLTADDLPEIVINEPQNGSITNKSSITILGSTSPLSKLKVGENNYNSDENGKFEFQYELSLGLNTILIKVTDEQGKSATKTITIEYQSETTTNPTSQPAIQQSAKESTDTNDFPINLSGKVSGNKLEFRWRLRSDLDVKKGFKLVRSESDTTPIFPKDTSVYIEDSDQREFTLHLSDNKTYHFRICIFEQDDVCTSYSNSVTLTTKGEQVDVNSISLKIKDNNDAQVKWEVDGNPEEGFRVLWSKSELSPSYPTTEGVFSKYLSNPHNTDTQVQSKAGSGNYYVRICAVNKNSSCAVYSNTIELFID